MNFTAKSKEIAKALWAAVGEACLQGMADQGLVLFAFNPAPNSWLPGYTSNAGAHTLSLETVAAGTAGLPLLTDALANAATGDIRAVMWAVLEAMYQEWVALGSANQPDEMTITKTVQTDPTTGYSTNRYAVAIVTVPTSATVAPEP